MATAPVYRPQDRRGVWYIQWTGSWWRLDTNRDGTHTNVSVPVMSETFHGTWTYDKTSETFRVRERSPTLTFEYSIRFLGNTGYAEVRYEGSSAIHRMKVSRKYPRKGE